MIELESAAAVASTSRARCEMTTPSWRVASAPVHTGVFARHSHANDSTCRLALQVARSGGHPPAPAQVRARDRGRMSVSPIASSKRRRAASRDRVMHLGSSSDEEGDTDTRKRIPQQQEAREEKAADAVTSSAPRNGPLPSSPLQWHLPPVKKRRLIRPIADGDADEDAALEALASPTERSNDAPDVAHASALSPAAPHAPLPASSVSSTPRVRSKLNPFVRDLYAPWQRSPAKQRRNQNARVALAPVTAGAPPLTAAIDAHGRVTFVRPSYGSKRVYADVITIDDDIAILEPTHSSEVEVIDLSDIAGDEEKCASPPPACDAAEEKEDESDVLLPRPRRRLLKLRIAEEASTEEDAESKPPTTQLREIESLTDDDISHVSSARHSAPPADASKAWSKREKQPAAVSVSVTRPRKPKPPAAKSIPPRPTPAPAPAVIPSPPTVVAPPPPSHDSTVLHQDHYQFPWLNTESDQPPPTYEQIDTNVDSAGVRHLQEPHVRAGRFRGGCSCAGGQCKRGRCACTKKGGAAYSYVNGRVQFPEQDGISQSRPHSARLRALRAVCPILIGF